MGITIHYRGSLDDLGRVEDFEDRVLDMALAVGGDARIWRSARDDDPTRMVRGLILSVAPGQESVSLLIAPEGWFVNLIDIEAAELGQTEMGQMEENPWCFVKTQFGPLEGHVAIVELFTAIQKQFCSNLEVHDESGYWEHRDVGRLQAALGQTSMAVDELAAALGSDRLSPEAAEDPHILATRVERIARQVHKVLARPPEHPPVLFRDEPDFAKLDPVEEEARWDQMYEENRRKQERMQRSIEERLARGEDISEALDSAIEEIVGPSIDSCDQDVDEEDDEDGSWELEDEEFMMESDGESEWNANEDDSELEEPHGHPLQKRAQEHYLRLIDILAKVGARSGFVESMMSGAGDLCGGIAQALSCEQDDELTGPEAIGLCVVQLKRAIRGAAFVLGGVPRLANEGLIDEEEAQQMFSSLQDLQTEIVGELKRVRALWDG